MSKYGSRVIGEKLFQERQAATKGGQDKYGSRVTGAAKYGSKVTGTQEEAQEAVADLAVKALKSFLAEHPDRVGDAITVELARPEPRKSALEFLRTLTEDETHIIAIDALLEG